MSVPEGGYDKGNDKLDLGGIGEFNPPFKLNKLVSSVKDAIPEVVNMALSEKINSNPSLKDVFEVVDGFIIVKKPTGDIGDGSRLLSGHFGEDMSIALGVLIRQLYEVITGKNIKEGQIRETKFLGSSVPGSKLIIVSDGVKSEDGEYVFRESIEEGKFEVPASFYGELVNGKTVVPLENSPYYIMHKDPVSMIGEVFIFKTKSSQNTDDINVGDVFVSKMIISDRQELLNSDGTFNLTFLDEFVAQVASAGYSSFVNKKLVLEKGIDAKNDDRFTLITYDGNRSSTVIGVKLNSGDTIRTEISVKSIDGRLLTVDYVVYRGDEVLQIGEITGVSMKRKALRKNLEKKSK